MVTKSGACFQVRPSYSLSFTTAGWTRPSTSSSVLTQFAERLGVTRVCYCVIDGGDLARLVDAYASDFKAVAKG